MSASHPAARICEHGRQLSICAICAPLADAAYLASRSSAPSDEPAVDDARLEGAGMLFMCLGEKANAKDIAANGPHPYGGRRSLHAVSLTMAEILRALAETEREIAPGDGDSNAIEMPLLRAAPSEGPTVDLDEALKRVDVSGLFDDPPALPVPAQEAEAAALKEAREFVESRRCNRPLAPRPSDSSRSNTPDTTGWLIERNENGYAEWLASLIEHPLRWTVEATDAILLETEEQAHREISRLRVQRSGDLNARPTEHVFIATSPVPAAPPSEIPEADDATAANVRAEAFAVDVARLLLRVRELEGLLAAQYDSCVCLVRLPDMTAARLPEADERAKKIAAIERMALANRGEGFTDREIFARSALWLIDELRASRSPEETPDAPSITGTPNG
jgi:hypothetical protein